MKLYKTFWKMVLVSIIAVFFVTGCQTVSELTSINANEKFDFRRGTVSLDTNDLIFTPCFEQKSETISDLTGRLSNYLSKGLSPLAYTEISGEQSQQTNTWQVHQVHLIGGAKNTCSYELEGNEFRAAGDRPEWMVDIGSRYIYVHNYQELTKLRFVNHSSSHTSNGFEWNSVIAGEVTHKLFLRLEHALCVDRYGTEYEFNTKMILDGKVHHGCARRGNLDLKTLPGSYRGEVPYMEGLQRSISMVLTAEGNVSITQDYHNDQPIIVHKGTWQRLAKKKLVLYLKDVRGADENEVLILQRNKRGVLELKGFSTIYGNEGLKFIRIGPIVNKSGFTG
ncbi:MAG: hypothetical protein ACRBB6_05190 [Neptuniibacter sp.]